MVEQDRRVVNGQEIWRLNTLIKTGIQARSDYFPQGVGEKDNKKVSLAMNKGDLQFLQTLNRVLVNSAYGYDKYVINSSPTFQIPFGEWDSFCKDQLSTSIDLKRKVSAAIFKTNSPKKPEDWLDLNSMDTVIDVKFQTARSLVQLIAGVMQVRDLEAKGLDKHDRSYFGYITEKNRDLQLINGIMSQLKEQGFPVNEDKIREISVNLKAVKPEAERVKLLSENSR